LTELTDVRQEFALLNSDLCSLAGVAAPAFFYVTTVCHHCALDWR